MSEDYTEHPEHIDETIPDTLPWEQKPKHGHRGLLLGILHVALIASGLGFSVGMQLGLTHVQLIDPPPTGHVATSGTNSTKDKLTIPRPPVSSQPNASFSWLTGAVVEMGWMVTACNACHVNMTNAIVGSLPASLQPKYDPTSGWYFVYGLYVVSGYQYNVTLSNCAPAKLIDFVSTAQGLSWSPYYPATDRFTPTGSTYEQSAECGVI